MWITIAAGQSFFEKITVIEKLLNCQSTLCYVGILSIYYGWSFYTNWNLPLHEVPLFSISQLAAFI